MSPENQALHEILYCSKLATGVSPAVVGAIVAHARVRNAQSGVTGLLVFDGDRFCHHFEGPRDAIVRLMDRIGDDPRHSDVRVVYEGPLARRRYPRFEMGLVDAEQDFPDLDLLDGEEALARFLELRPGYDVS